MIIGLVLLFIIACAVSPEFMGALIGLVVVMAIGLGLVAVIALVFALAST